jgi:probable HAF family extracellular repeat protein
LINDRGHVAGTSTFDEGNHVFLHTNRMRDLGDLGGFDIQLWGMNDAKDIVGWRNDWDFGPRAIACPQGGAMIDLPPLEGQESSQAFAVNASGWVIGNALLTDGQRRGVLWRLR